MNLPQSCMKLVLWNCNARCADGAQVLRDTLAEDRSVRIVDTESAEDSEAKARQAAAEGVPLLVAAGGDGSIHAVLQGLMQESHQTTLGVLPLGTGNDLCRTLRIPLDPWAAWETILLGRTGAIDITKVSASQTSRFFSNMANGGNSSRLLDSLTDEMKQTWGTWAYLRAALHILTDMQTYPLRVKIDDQAVEEFQAWNVVLANGNTAGAGMQVAPRASLTDGLLDVIVILDGTPFELAELATDLLAGDYLDHERVIYRLAKRLQLEFGSPIDMIVDGEVISGTQFDFEVVPHALNVVVGREFAPLAGE